MKIRPEALAVWDAADEDSRRAIVEHAMARVTLECEQAVARGWAHVAHRPEIEIVRAREAPHLVATIASNYRAYFQAQSGSDWGDHVISIVDAYLDRGEVIERELHYLDLNVTEQESEDYDDEAASRYAIDSWLRTGAVSLERAIAGAQTRAGRDATVEVIRVQGKTIATAAVVAGVVRIEETRADTLEATVVREAADDARTVIARYLAR